MIKTKKGDGFVKKWVIVLGSVTYALKAKEILQKNNIVSYMERNKKTKEFGCGYGVTLGKNYKNIDNVVELLKSNGIKILAVLESEG